MDVETQHFFMGAGLIVAGLLFAFTSERFVGVKLAKFWFLVTIPLILGGIHFLKPSLLPDLVNQLRAGH